MGKRIIYISDPSGYTQDFSSLPCSCLTQDAESCTGAVASNNGVRRQGFEREESPIFVGAMYPFDLFVALANMGIYSPTSSTAR